MCAYAACTHLFNASLVCGLPVVARQVVTLVLSKLYGLRTLLAVSTLLLVQILLYFFTSVKLF
jgi:hypothetical protein